VCLGGEKTSRDRDKDKAFIERRIQGFLQGLEDDWKKEKVEEVGRLHDELVPTLSKYPQVVVLSVLQILQHEYIAEIVAEVKVNPLKPTDLVASASVS